MERTYTYENAVVSIYIPDGSISRIQEATENFMKKVIIEGRTNNDNITKSGNITQK